MNYRELQAALRPYKEQGKTQIMLTSTKGMLEAELERLEGSVTLTQIEEEKTVTSEDIPPFEPFDPLEVALQMMDEQVAKTEAETPQPTDTQEVDTVAKILPLAIEGRWFDMIASGEKKEEYRDIKPHYQSRFKKEWTHIKFTNGYGSDRPSFTIELLGIEKGIPKPEWSEGTIEQGTEVFVLKLGKIVDANFPLPTISKGDSGLICPECEGTTGEILNEQGEYEPCNDCDGTGRLEGIDEDEPIAWIDGEALYAPFPNADYHCADDVDLFIDDVDEEIETFLGDVPQLSDEQKEAITSALTFANDRSVTASEALAQIGQFRLFTPKQLLSWGFDHIIPRSGMLARFRDAATFTPPQKTAIVRIHFSPNLQNAALITAWSDSYGGIPWRLGLTEGSQNEDWCFPSVEVAEQFREFCQKLEFVQSVAIVDRIGTEQKAMVGVG